MKYVVVMNLLDRETGRPTPLKLSCEFKDLPREAAVMATIKYAERQGLRVNPIPSSVRSVGAPPRRAAKVRLPSL